jgi:signal transduction histidine kinase/ActR/RegA family two-component response regulator
LPCPLYCVGNEGKEINRDHNTDCLLMKKKTPYPFSSRFYLTAILSCLFLLDAFILWQVSKLDYDRTLDRARLTLQKTSISLEERMKRTLIATEAILHTRAQRIEELGITKVISSAKEWQRFRKAAEALPDSGSLWLLDDKANLLMDSTEYPSRQMNFKEREYFAPQRDKGIEFYIGPVVKGKITRKYSFTISHRINGKEGKFLGIVVAAIDTEDFTNFLRTIDIGKESTISVFRTDGALILRKPMEDRHLGRNFRHLTLFSEPFVESSSGIFETDRIDGTKRLVAYRKIKGLPLLAATGIPLDSILTEWRTRVKAYSAFAGLIFLVLLGLSLLVYKTTMRQEKEKAKEMSLINQSLQAEILERKRAEADKEHLLTELSTEKALWQATVENMLDPVTLCDAEGRVTYINRAYHQLIERPIATNLPAEEHPEYYQLYRTDGTLFPVDELPLQKATRTGEEVRDIEIVQHSSTGKEFRAIFSAAPLRNAEQKVLGAVAVGHDVTEQRRIEQALKKTLDELETRVQERTSQLSQAYEALQREVEDRTKLEGQLRRTQKLEAIGVLAGGIAHDFNNILAGIIGFTEMVMEDVTPGGPDFRRLELVLRGAHRGRYLVKQILAFSRHTEHDRKPIALNQTIKEGLKLLRPTLPSTVRIVSHSLTDDDMVLADSAQIHQVLMNLCTNAAHAMREKGGVLDITISNAVVTESNSAPVAEMAPGEYVVIEVRDTGCGMDPETMERIFDPFFTTKEQGEGTGLGLSVVHGIVKGHDGYIAAESKPGMGSTFRVYLPKGKEFTHTKEKETPPLTGRKERVLFVDDEDILVELNTQRLTRLGYEVVATTSSVEALDLFRKEPDRFSLVITDQTMPNLAGMDLAVELLKVRAAIPIILCTGHSEAVSPERIREVGIKALLMKPLTKQELAGTIRRLLDREAGQ